MITQTSFWLICLCLPVTTFVKVSRRWMISWCFTCLRHNGLKTKSYNSHLTLCHSFKAIQDDRKHLLLTKCVCKKDRVLQWWYKHLFHILEVWHAAVSAHWHLCVFLLYCIKTLLKMLCITYVDDNLAEKKETLMY